MKKYILIFLLLLTLGVRAGSPQKFLYQFPVKNNLGAVVSNTLISVKITLHQASVGNIPTYTEVHSVTTSADGLATVIVGTGTPEVGNNFSTLIWEEGPYFIKAKVDITGGSSFKLVAGKEIMSVPYAMHVSVADTCLCASSNNYNDLQNNPVQLDEDKSNDMTTADAQTVQGNKVFTGTIAVPVGVNNNEAVSKEQIKVLEQEVIRLERILRLCGITN